MIWNWKWSKWIPLHTQYIKILWCFIYSILLMSLLLKSNSYPPLWLAADYLYYLILYPPLSSSTHQPYCLILSYKYAKLLLVFNTFTWAFPFEWLTLSFIQISFLNVISLKASLDLPVIPLSLCSTCHCLAFFLTS